MRNPQKHIKYENRLIFYNSFPFLVMPSLLTRQFQNIYLCSYIYIYVHKYIFEINIVL